MFTFVAGTCLVAICLFLILGIELTTQARSSGSAATTGIIIGPIVPTLGIGPCVCIAKSPVYSAGIVILLSNFINYFEKSGDYTHTYT